MIYRVIGLMSGSSLDGLDLAFVEFDESGGKWNFEIQAAACIPYSSGWKDKLQQATQLTAYEYMLLHTAYGRYIGQQVNNFIEDNHLHHRVQLIVSHGHTTFHVPAQGLTAQLGDGAAIAAATHTNVVSDLRAVDVAFGGEGAPIVPVGEKLLFSDYQYCLNLGGIANISYNGAKGYVAFDVCAANRVLDLLASTVGKQYDDGGALAASGKVFTPLLTRLNAFSYYKRSYPKSLANSFGTDEVYPVIMDFDISVEDKMRTYVEHIAMQVSYAIQQFYTAGSPNSEQMLVSGGGACNTFLINRIRHHLQALQISVIVPPGDIIHYKEALIMALIGVLRWREEYNVLHTVTGATRSSIGGAVWIGQEA